MAQGDLQRQVKLLVFTPKVIEQLGKQYSNTDTIPSPTIDPENAVPIDAANQEGGVTADKKSVRELTHDLLYTLCTSSTKGLVFPLETVSAFDAGEMVFMQQAPSAETSNRAAQTTATTAAERTRPLGIDAAGDDKGTGRKYTANPVVLRILQAIELDFSDPLIRALVIGSLQACPDIIPAFIRDTSLFAEPELSLTWMLRMTLLEELFSIQPPSLQTIGPCAAIKHRLDCALPPAGPATTTLVRGLQNKTALVRFAALKVLCRMLRHLAVLRTNSDAVVAEYGRHEWQHEYAAAVRRYAARLFTLAKKRLPGLEVCSRIHAHTLSRVHDFLVPKTRHSLA